MSFLWILAVLHGSFAVYADAAITNAAKYQLNDTAIRQGIRYFNSQVKRLTLHVHGHFECLNYLTGSQFMLAFLKEFEEVFYRYKFVNDFAVLFDQVFTNQNRALLYRALKYKRRFKLTYNALNI